MEYLTAAEVAKKNGVRSNNMVQAFQTSVGHAELLAKLVEFFPYPIQVATPDGTLVLANEAFFKTFHMENKDEVIGKYNFLQDPILERLGIKEKVLQVFNGEMVKLSNIKAPMREIIDRFGKRQLFFDSIFFNITSFPIYNDKQQLAYVASVFITTKLYSGKEEIIKGMEYIASHRQEDFDMDAVAKASGLSKTQFTRLFKAQTGLTPHDYYMDMKINMIKEKILNANLSISQAFSECGLNYNGHYAKIFKERVGATPSQYRKSNR